MVASTPSTLRIAVYGPEEAPSNENRGCGLWATGYAAALAAAGATPVLLGETVRARTWSDALADVHGLVWTGRPRPNGLPNAEEERLNAWCRKNRLPLLAVDHALLTLNVANG